MKKKVLEALSKVNSEIAYHTDSNLVQEGIIDSFDIMNIVKEIESSFGIELDPDDIIIENFNTVDAIVNLILNKKGNP